MTKPPLPAVSRGAATLIAIARENDKRRQLATNQALHFALVAVQELPALCRASRRKALAHYLRVEQLTRSFSPFCASLTRRSDQQLRALERPPKNQWLATTCFDHAVLQAVGQTLLGLVPGGMAAWSDLEACLRVVAEAAPRDLQERL